ncbi:MAG TPA: hypothetical protein VFA45_01640 [Actinomycetes bacterium]|jgi:hypothetical protein|nr:hypothetical protein [Actinomycetes bacterium]
MGDGASSTESSVSVRQGPRQWHRPSYLDDWSKPAFLLEEYAFTEPLLQKHRDVQFWAGNQIGFLTEAAIEELASRGRSLEQVVEALKKGLRSHFRADTEQFLQRHPIAASDRNARTIGHLIMRWEAALGVAGEIMINTPDRFLRRFYDPGSWYKFATPAVIEIIRGGEGEGVCQAVNRDFTFRMNRISAAGDPFDEWVVERVDQSSAGRHLP